MFIAYLWYLYILCHVEAIDVCFKSNVKLMLCCIVFLIVVMRCQLDTIVFFKCSMLFVHCSFLFKAILIQLMCFQTCALGAFIDNPSSLT